MRIDKTQRAKPDNVFSLPADVWKGEPTFIVGGGASLQGFDFNRLRGRGHVIAVNDAYHVVPWAEYLYFADARWWDWNKKKVEKFEGTVVTRIATKRAESNKIAHRIGKSNRIALSHNCDVLAGFCGGSNAINMAYLLGGQPTFLLGFDMYPGNWHTNHKLPHVEGQHRDKFVPFIEWMAEELNGCGFRVYNTNPKSQLRCFPFIGLEELLSMDDLSKIEQETYEFMWRIPAYRKTSPGMRECERAFKIMGIKAGEGLYDFGAGPGRATSWFLDQGVDAVAIDLVENALEDKEVPFAYASLWLLPETLKPVEWGFCCDVMEHIPTEKVDPTLYNIASRVTEGAWFRICLVPDRMGPKFAGKALHQTVKGAEWWRRKLEKQFPFVDVVELSRTILVARCMNDAEKAKR